ncbi:Six-hairpin glycosidase-like protein [Kalaharituber pfeilii]|nr:Six-hairpin glycosidase-like protein [Kalaharituber pfeilii]
MARLRFNCLILVGTLSALLHSAVSLSLSPKYLVSHKQPVLKSPVQAPTPLSTPDAVLEDWISHERVFAFNQILANIGPNGANATGTAPGCILASPSKYAPNYFYQWVRDGAITISSLIEQWEKGRWPLNEEQRILDDLLQIFLNYVDMQGKLQATNNPSGGYYSGGLGEPKFEVNGSPFVRSWGRPQRDGPALRASAIVAFLNAAHNTRPDLLHNQALLRKLYTNQLPANSIIKADLEYVSHAWHERGFDAWEEIEGFHFFTAMVQYRALAEGQSLALKFNDPGASAWYEQQRNELGRFLWRFWDSRKGHLISTLDDTRRSGLNCDLLLGSIHGDGKVFPPWSDEVLATLEKLVKAMEKLHPDVNGQRRGVPKPVGMGRYAEDVYDGVGFTGGNAWFICTSSAAQVIYSSITEFVARHRKLVVNDVNRGFFELVNPELAAFKGSEVGMYDQDGLFNATMKWMFEYADGFVDLVKRHATPQGRMAEQFDTWSGKQHGAQDLTWSYGSFISAMEKRDSAKAMVWA